MPVAVDGDYGRDVGADDVGVVTRTPASIQPTGAPESSAELGRLLALDPAAALASAAELRGAHERRRAVLLVGTRSASADPIAALALASKLPASLRADYEASVSREWANLDPEGFLRFAESAADSEPLIGGLELLIPNEPFRVFGVVSRVTRVGDWTLLQLAAATAMAEQDAMLALRSLETAPRGPASDMLLWSVLAVHGRNDPDAALAWLDTQESPSAAVQAAIFRGIAQRDFERGFRLLTERIPASSLGGPTMDSELVANAAADSVSTVRIANTLLDIGSARALEILEEVIGAWARRDPTSLVDWMIRSSAAIEPRLVGSIGLRIASNDLELARSLVDRLPPSIANAWVPQIAGSYARQDPEAALDWIARYRGQPFYDDALAQAVLQAAEKDPELVASMLPRMPASLQAVAIPNIAAAWVQRDPRAAADWVAGLEGLASESGAAGRIISGWMRRDLDAAARWALGLRRGLVRDEALRTLIAGSYGVDLDARALFAEIESADLRRDAAMWAVATNRDLARDFLESLLDDEELRDWARETLERVTDQN